MIRKKVIAIIALMFVITGLSYNLKQLYQEKIFISNIDTLNLELDKLITKKYFIDSSKVIKILFVYKIAPNGEIDSTYIRRSFNFKEGKSNMICKQIELKFKLLFLYNEFKYSKDNNNFVSCAFSYSNIR